MINCWNSLIQAQQVFALVGIAATVILVIQTVMMLFGFGDDADTDIDDADIGDAGDGLVIFSIKGIVAMLCILGWTGVIFLGTGMNHVLAIFLAFLCGVAALIGMAFIMRAVAKLQSSGNIDAGNAIGKVGQVYIPIKGNASAQGKVTLTVQGTFTEFSAITMSNETLPTGSYVRVVAVDEAGTLLVEPVAKPEK